MKVDLWKHFRPLDLKCVPCSGGVGFRYLLVPQQRARSVNDIMPMIGARFFSQLDAAQTKIDILENELAKVGGVQP